MDLQEKIEHLARRISELAQQQSATSRMLLQLMDELEQLKKQATAAGSSQATEVDATPIKTVEYTEPIVPPSKKTEPYQPNFRSNTARPKQRSSWEEFVGKNLASKVGILVTIVGIFIGARYAIEHNLVSPIVRIVSGYLSGTTLIVLAIFLKKKYEAYSSVLMGGGLAVLYFITYTAYSFYGLLPQLTSFMLMLIFTVATVYASLVYNRVVIAHLGLVGAYAIPFLLSDNSGRYFILFSYITIINAGILVLAFRKYWKSLFYSAFFLTWAIYIAWYLAYYDVEHFTMAFAFSSIFFASFYFTFLAYKLVKKENYGADAVMILLSNAFIFYGLGYNTLVESESNDQSTGLFTIINAAIHFGVSQLIRPRLADRALYYLVFGLAIVFITIAIPVQFDGNWVTLLWIAEAVLMFVIGRTRGVATYEKLSGILLLLGVFSLGEDWIRYGEQFDEAGNGISPFANIIFVSGLLVSGAIGSMLWLSRNKKYASSLPGQNFYRSYLPYIITVFFFLVTYLVFFLEILAYFSQVSATIAGSRSLWRADAVDGFRDTVILLYSMVFVAIIVFINQRWVKSIEMSTAALAAIGILAMVLLTRGLPTLNELGRYYQYLHEVETPFGMWNFNIRYIVAAMMILLLLQGRDIAKSFSEKKVNNSWQLIIHGMVLALLSAEYLHWTGISGDGDQYKLGLSILWGVYALYLIIWGIYKKQKHLRLAAIVVFIITLGKLFIYDLDEAGTVTKTISFISLGAILLLVSYLYNRYKEVLFGKDE
jgi:uncharacterized membrane protein